MAAESFRVKGIDLIAFFLEIKMGVVDSSAVFRIRRENGLYWIDVRLQGNVLEYILHGAS